MNPQDDKVDKLEGALKATWRAPEVPTATPEWQAGVMAEVRSLQAEAPTLAPAAPYCRCIWQFAAAAALAVVLFGLWGLLGGMGPEAEMAQLLMGDPTGLVGGYSFGF